MSRRDGKPTMAGTARHYLRLYFEEFLDKNRDLLIGRDALASPLKLFVLYESFVREKVLEANPDLAEMGNGPRLDALVRRIIPEFPQFIGVWLEGFDTVPGSPPLQTPNVRKGFVKGKLDEETGLG